MVKQNFISEIKLREIDNVCKYCLMYPKLCKQYRRMINFINNFPKHLDLF